MQKAGNEQYLLLPANGQSIIPAGTYYIAVVSEGLNPTASVIGTNTSSFTVASFGSEQVTNLGTVGGVLIFCRRIRFRAAATCSINSRFPVACRQWKSVWIMSPAVLT